MKAEMLHLKILKINDLLCQKSFQVVCVRAIAFTQEQGWEKNTFKIIAK